MAYFRNFKAPEPEPEVKPVEVADDSTYNPNVEYNRDLVPTTLNNDEGAKLFADYGGSESGEGFDLTVSRDAGNLTNALKYNYSMSQTQARDINRIAQDSEAEFELVKDNPEAYKQYVENKKILIDVIGETKWDYTKNEKVAQYPCTLEYLTYPDKMAQAKDSVKTLTMLEQLYMNNEKEQWGFLRRGVGALNAWGTQFQGDIVRLWGLGTAVSQAPANFVSTLINPDKPQLNTVPKITYDNAVTRYLDKVTADQKPMTLSKSATDAMAKGDIAGAGAILFDKVINNMPQQIMVVGSAIAGHPELSLAIMGLTQGSGTFADNMKQGMSQNLALGNGLTQMSSEMFTEMYGTLGYFKKFERSLVKQLGKKQGQQLFKEFAKKAIVEGAVPEGVEEAVNSYIQDASNYITGATDSMEGWEQRALESGMVGFGSGVGGSAMVVRAMHQKYQKSMANQNLLKGLNKTLANDEIKDAGNMTEEVIINNAEAYNGRKDIQITRTDLVDILYEDQDTLKQLIDTSDLSAQMEDDIDNPNHIIKIPIGKFYQEFAGTHLVDAVIEKARIDGQLFEDTIVNMDKVLSANQNASNMLIAQLQKSGMGRRIFSDMSTKTLQDEIDNGMPLQEAEKIRQDHNKGDTAFSNLTLAGENTLVRTGKYIEHVLNIARHGKVTAVLEESVEGWLKEEFGDYDTTTGKFGDGQFNILVDQAMQSARENGYETSEDRMEWLSTLAINRAFDPKNATIMERKLGFKKQLIKVIKSLSKYLKDILVDAKKTNALIKDGTISAELVNILDKASRGQLTPQELDNTVESVDEVTEAKNTIELTAQEIADGWNIAEPIDTVTENTVTEETATEETGTDFTKIAQDYYDSLKGKYWANIRSNDTKVAKAQKPFEDVLNEVETAVDRSNVLSDSDFIGRNKNLMDAFFNAMENENLPRAKETKDKILKKTRNYQNKTNKMVKRAKDEYSNAPVSQNEVPVKPTKQKVDYAKLDKATESARKTSEKLQQLAPVISFISDNGGIAPRGKAKHKGGEYDGQIPITETRGMAKYIYGGEVGGLQPDEMAQILYDEKLINEPNTDVMWNAIAGNITSYNTNFEKPNKLTPEEARAEQALTEAEASTVTRAIHAEPQSATTQLGGAKQAQMYVKAIGKIMNKKPIVDGTNKILDYGAGRGNGTQLMGETYTDKTVDSFEPNPVNWEGNKPPTYTKDINVPNNAYDYVISPNVLNVIPKVHRPLVYKDIANKITDKGIAVISTRGWKNDVGATKKFKEVEGEPHARRVLKKNKETGKIDEVYQRGFDGNELLDEVQEAIGDGYTVKKISGIGKSAVSIEVKPVQNKTYAIQEGNGIDLRQSVISSKWMQGNTAVNEDGSPIQFYAGTLTDFDTYDKEKANPEGNMGGGFYFTTNPEDASNNYGTPRGADQQNKIDRRAEEIDQIYDEDPTEVEKMARDLGLLDLKEDDYLSLKNARAIATAEISDHGGAVMPVWLSVKKPAVIDGDRSTFLEFEELYLEDDMEDLRAEVREEDPDVDEEDVEELAREKYLDNGIETEPSGELSDFLDALDEISYLYEYEGYRNDFDELADAIRNEAYGEGLSLLSLYAKFKYYLENVENQNGKFASIEIFRQTLEDIGFDAIQDKTVSEKFGNMGLEQGDEHVIVFHPNQIKSSTGNNGEFSTTDNRMTRSLQTMSSITNQYVSAYKKIRSAESVFERFGTSKYNESIADVKDKILTTLSEITGVKIPEKKKVQQDKFIREVKRNNSNLDTIAEREEAFITRVEEGLVGTLEELQAGVSSISHTVQTMLNNGVNVKDIENRTKSGVKDLQTQLIDIVREKLPRELQGRALSRVKTIGQKYGSRPEAIARYLEETNRAIADMLENVEKWKNIKKINNLIKTSKTKLTSSNIREGKVMPQLNERLDYINRIMRLDTEHLESEERVIESLYNNALDDAGRADAVTKLADLSLFGDLSAQSSYAVQGAFEDLSKIVNGAKAERFQILADRKAKDMEMVSKIVNILTKGKGVATGKERQDIEVAQNKTFNKLLARIKSVPDNQKQIEMLINMLAREETSTESFKSTLSPIYDEIHKASRDKITMLRESSERVMNAYADITGAERIRGKAFLKGVLARAKEDVNLQKESGVIIKDKNGNDFELVMSQMEALQYWLSSEQVRGYEIMSNHGWSEASFEQLDKFTSPEMRAFGEVLRNEYKIMYPKANEVFEYLFFNNLPDNQNYAPIAIEGSRADESFSMDDLKMGVAPNLVNPSAIKERLNHDLPLRKASAMDMYNKNVAEMAHFTTNGKLSRKLKAIFSNKETQDAIRQTKGHKFLKTFNTVIGINIRGGVDVTQVDRTAEGIRKATTLFILAGKVDNVIKQATSGVAGIAEVGMGNMAKGTAEFLANPVENAKWMMELDWFKNRWETGFNKDIKLLQKSHNLTPKNLWTAGIDMAMLPTKLGDIIGVMPSFYAVYKTTLESNTKEGILTPEEAKADAILQAEKFSDRVQQASAMKDMGYSQTQNSWAKLFQTFMTSQRQYMNVTMEALADGFKEGASSKQRAKALRHAFIFWAVLPCLFQGAGDLFRMAFDEDWEFDWRNYLIATLTAPLTGQYIIAPIMYVMAQKYLKNKNYSPQLLPATSTILESIMGSVEDLTEGEIQESIDTLFKAQGGYKTIKMIIDKGE